MQVLDCLCANDNCFKILMDRTILPRSSLNQVSQYNLERSTDYKEISHYTMSIAKALLPDNYEQLCSGQVFKRKVLTKYADLT
jgi:hypothetical protein